MTSISNKSWLKKYQQLPEVESRTQGSRPRPRPRKQKKFEAKDSLSEDRTSQGQGQECSRPRPRTKDTGASVPPPKKRSSKFFFQAISNLLAYPKFLIGVGLKHKSYEMTPKNFSKEEVFVGLRYRTMEDLKSLLPVGM